MTTIRFGIIAFVFASGVAAADSRPDPHAEMAAALAAQIDDHPPPAKLPTALPHGNPSQLNGPNSHASANGQLHGGEGQANALQHQAEAASNAAVGQQRAQDAKNRAGMHPHPGK